MSKILSTRTSLWILFLTTILLTASFPILSNRIGITFIDALSDPSQVRATIAAMSDVQRGYHAWVTATLDVAYPLAYGAFFIGSAYAFFPTWGRLFALVFVGLIATDVLEGVVQVLALTGISDLLIAKTILTPLKFALFILGAGVTLSGWALWSVSKISGK